MTYQFKWKPGSRIKISPQKAGERIEALQRRFGGKLANRDVVNDARNLNSPLHNAFDWKDSRAAEKYREQQASYLLRCLVTVYVGTHDRKPKGSTRVYVNVQPRGTRPGDRNYRPIVDVLNDEQLRRELLETAANEFKAWRSRYSELRELSRLFDVGEIVFAKVFAKKPKKKAA